MGIKSIDRQQLIRLGLALGCGALSSLGYAPFGYFFIWWVTLPWLAYLIFADQDLSSASCFTDRLKQVWRPHRQAFLLGWVFGGGYFTAGLYWIGESFFVKGGIYIYIAPFAILFLGFGLGLFTACTYWMISYFKRLWQIDLYSFRLVLLIGICWCIFDLLRGVILTGFPWQIAGYIWYQLPEIVQSVSVIGVQGLGLWTILIMSMPLLIWPWLLKKAAIRSKAKLDGADTSRKSWQGNLVFSCILLAVSVSLGWFGHQRLQAFPTSYQNDVRLRIVQPSIDQREKWNPRFRDRNLADYIYRSQTDGFDRITHVIWPETALPFNIDLLPDLLKRTAFAVPPEGYLLTGALRSEPAPWDPDQPERRLIFRNSFAVLDEKADIIAGYHKSHLVPFGEYVPFSQTALFKWTKIGIYDFSPGSGVSQIKVPGLPKFIPLICYEILFPAQVMPDIAEGEARPEWMLNLTNDAWFGTSSGPYQHLQIARYRGIEEGLPVVRAANTGVSAIFDAYGREIAMIGLMEKGILDSYLPKPVEGITFFGKWHHLTLYLLLIGLSLYQIASYLLLRRK